jgi:hypothetical protein
MWMCLKAVSDRTVDPKIESDTPSGAQFAGSSSSSSTLQLHSAEKHAEV